MRLFGISVELLKSERAYNMGKDSGLKSGGQS